MTPGSSNNDVLRVRQQLGFSSDDLLHARQLLADAMMLLSQAGEEADSRRAEELLDCATGWMVDATVLAGKALAKKAKAS